MNKVARWLFPVALGLIFSCNNKDKESSPYGEILNKPPYDLLTDSIRKDSKNDELLFRRAVLLNKNNLPEPALADFQKAWSLKKDERYAFGTSTILLESKPDSALLFLQEAVRELPQSNILRINLARAYDQQNRVDEALNVCNQMLQSNPTQVDVLKLKSSLLEKKGNYSASLAELEKAYALTPFDVDLNYSLAFKYAEDKNPKVIRLCDSLIKKDSIGSHAEPYYFKGLYYSNLQDQTKAMSMFDQAIRHDYNFKNAYIEKGRILLDQKQTLDAYKVFNLVMTIDPSFADAYYWMAQCEEKMGKKEEAKLNYQRAYSLDKTFLEAKEAADRL